MKSINHFILEKLKLNSQSKLKEPQVHNADIDDIIDHIFIMENLDEAQSLGYKTRKYIENWISENNVESVEYVCDIDHKDIIDEQCKNRKDNSIVVNSSDYIFERDKFKKAFKLPVKKINTNSIYVTVSIGNKCISVFSLVKGTVFCVKNK